MPELIFDTLYLRRASGRCLQIGFVSRPFITRQRGTQEEYGLRSAHFFAKSRLVYKKSRLPAKPMFNDRGREDVTESVSPPRAACASQAYAELVAGECTIALQSRRTRL